MKELGPERRSMGNVKLGVSVNLCVFVPKTASNQSSILSFQIKAVVNPECEFMQVRVF